MATTLNVAMFVSLLGLLMAGFPVALTLAGTALAFIAVGVVFGVFDPAFLGAIPQRIFGVMTNEVLLAVPLFIFMGVLLERSRVANDMLESMGRLFGTLPCGLAFSVTIVGALMAASTGIVGATVVTMGLLALPTMMRQRYDPALSCGVIAASGTLGQIIPPSIILVLLGDVLSSAYQRVQLESGTFSPETVSVSDLFAGAMLPGLLLVGLYLLYLVGVAWLRPEAGPPLPRREAVAGISGAEVKETLRVLIAPVSLIIAVLGSILAGIATPTEAAAVGALGAILLSGHKTDPGRGGPIYTAAISLAALLILTGVFDLRVMRTQVATAELLAIIAAFIACAGVLWGCVVSLHRTFRGGVLQSTLQSTGRITAMIFLIIIGAGVFALAFRGFGGDDLVEAFLLDLPGGRVAVLVIVMALIFGLGFFLDVIEITYVVVPIVAPVLLKMDISPVWLGVMMAINLQTSYLTPPFGLALFFLQGVTPPGIKMAHIYKGIVPFVVIQLICLAIVAMFPELATWLPRALFGR